jgi:hypothetical protein
MNEMILKEYTPQRAVYIYKPEGKGDGGEVAYDMATGETSVLIKADGDILGRDAYRVSQKMKNFIKERNALPLNTIQAWY